MKMIKTPLFLWRLVQKFIYANYKSIMGICGKIFDDFIINSHNLQMLCCELNVRHGNLWASLGKFGQKSFAPLKICLLLHKDVKHKGVIENNNTTRLSRLWKSRTQEQNTSAKRTQMAATAMTTIRVFVTFQDCKESNVQRNSRAKEYEV